MKDETKNGPPRTSDGDHGQDKPRADTVVTEGAEGIERLKKLMKRVLTKAGVLIFF